ncbi:hypothetical protein A167_03068 [Alcanivorax sp. S71-1-4]|nr:hypothetical protein A167_03068 [Alcanivorax sp. S71-1-4]
MTYSEMDEELLRFNEARLKFSLDKKNELIEKNRILGEKYASENSLDAGVVTLGSGIQYKVIASGTGDRLAGDNDIVSVNYEAAYVDGRVFDDSLDREETPTFKVKDSIPGWREVLKMMKEGDIWEVMIPATMAYGEKGYGDTIEPGMTLIYRMSLESIEE